MGEKAGPLTYIVVALHWVSTLVDELAGACVLWEQAGGRGVGLVRHSQSLVLIALLYTQLQFPDSVNQVHWVCEFAHSLCIASCLE